MSTYEGTKIITARMVRDTLAFKGDLSMRGLTSHFKCTLAELARPLAQAVARGEVQDYSYMDSLDGIDPILMFTTNWKDDVKAS